MQKNKNKTDLTTRFYYPILMFTVIGRLRWNNEKQNKTQQVRLYQLHHPPFSIFYGNSHDMLKSCLYPGLHAGHRCHPVLVIGKTIFSSALLFRLERFQKEKGENIVVPQVAMVWRFICPWKKMRRYDNIYPIIGERRKKIN